jgi:hypothetical protein
MFSARTRQARTGGDQGDKEQPGLKGDHALIEMFCGRLCENLERDLFVVVGFLILICEVNSYAYGTGPRSRFAIRIPKTLFLMII